MPTWRRSAAAGQVDSGLDALEAAVTKLDYPDLAELRKSGDYPHSNPRFRDLTDLRVNAVPTGSTVLGNSSGLVEVVNRSRFSLTDLTIRLRYVGTFKPSRMGQMPVERKVAVVETIDRLEPTESRPIAFRTDAPPKRDRRGQLDASVTVSSPRQGSVTVPVAQLRR